MPALDCDSDLSVYLQQHQTQNRLRGKLISKQVAAALASHQDVPASKTNGAGGGKPRVMVIGEKTLRLTQLLPEDMQ